MDKKNSERETLWILYMTMLHCTSNRNSRRNFCRFHALSFYLRFSVFLLAVSRSERSPTQECISVE